MKRLAGLLIVVALLLPACGPPETVQAELLDLADRYLEARNTFITNAAGSGIDPTVGMTDAFRERLEADLAVLADRRDGTYASAETRLTALSWGYGGDSATLVADEHTWLTYVPNDTDTPTDSAYAWERRFEFVRADDGRWVLSADVWPTEGHGLPETVVT